MPMRTAQKQHRMHCQKPKTKLLLNFGLHMSREHATPIRGHIRRFKPHIFVMETDTLLEKGRIKNIRSSNDAISEARKDSSKRKSLINGSGNPFKEEQAKALLETDGLLGYAVEAYSQGQLREFGGILLEWMDLIPRAKLMSAGRVAEAIELEEKLVRKIGAGWIRQRDKRIIRGFEALGQECKEEYGLAPKGGLRVFARFGSGHAYVGKGLSELGFEVEIARDAPNPILFYKIMERLSENPDAKISREEGVQLLFMSVWDIQDTGIWSKSEGHIVSDIKKKYGRIGRGEGFLAMLAEAAKTKSPREWVEFVCNAIHGN